MKIKITVIEDKPDHSVLIGQLSADPESEVFIADNIVDFYGIAENKPDVIILDDYLQAGFSNQLYHILKSNETTKDIPVLLISDIESLEEDVFRISIDDFIPKPFNPDMLINKIDDMLHAA
jgi:DNA-binding response OmpR family regulator